MTQAIIFIPAGHPFDASFARQCLDHCIRRGYRLLTILREWSAVLDALAAGKASVVVMIPGYGRHARPRLVGRGTRRVSHRVGPAKPATSRGVVAPVDLHAEQVREVIDGDGAITHGLDPQTIAAARRIAQHFAECGQG